MTYQSNFLDDNFIYQPPTSQHYQFKIYINDCDSYIGSELVQQFRNDHLIQTNPNIIIGSLTQPSLNNSKENDCLIPPGVNSIINLQNQCLYNSVLHQSDIILFTLSKGNIKQFQYILKLLKNATLEKQKQIVCVTSFLSWASQPPITNSTASKSKLNARNSLDYHVKILQDACLAINHENPKVKGSVVFSGLVYGLGEDSLLSHFKRALQQQKPLQVYGMGTNFVPTIHLKDLTQIVFNILFQPNEKDKNWYFACDQSRVTQRDLIRCIAQTLGNKMIVEKTIEECFWKDNFDDFTIDLVVDDPQKLSEWHCKDGFIEQISNIISEFNLYRGLKANKILIIGPPVSGKSTIAENLKKNYGLALINIKNLIESIQQDDTDFGKTTRTLLEDLKTQKIQEERKAHEEIKKKKKAKTTEEFDPSKIVARLPEEQLKKVIKWRLNFSDCLNKGYILDSVIKTYKVAEAVFLDQNNNIDQKIFPNSIFFVKAHDQQIKDRVKSLPPEKTESTHWTEEHTIRRLQNYSKQNEEKSLKSFFQNKVDIKQIPFQYSDNSIFVKFIERNGPLGFKKQVEVIEKPINQNIKKTQKADDYKQEPQQKQEQPEQDQQQEVEEEFNLERLTEKQQKILNEKSRPIRQYLIDNVIPDITEGLLEICKEVPEDPIQFLIGFLSKKNSKKK